MFINKENGILPNQYHWTYEQGDTLIYPEHIADLFVVGKMWSNRQKYRQSKDESKRETRKTYADIVAGKQKQTIKNQGGNSNFYGRKFVYKK